MQRAQRICKNLCVLRASAVRVSYITFKWRTPGTSMQNSLGIVLVNALGPLQVRSQLEARPISRGDAENARNLKAQLLGQKAHYVAPIW